MAVPKTTPRADTGNPLALDGAEALRMDQLRAAGTAFLGAIQGPGLAGRLHELMHRIETGTETPEDRRLLDSLPPCHMSPRQLVALFNRVERVM